MSDNAPVVWLDEGAARDDAVRALHEWAAAREVRLGILEERSPPALVDPSLGDLVDKELERARLAIGAADADAAERALARAESVLRGHPELPQAAWLRAEVERAWSGRWLRLEPRDELRARLAWENAQALDGGRVPGVGEATSPPRPKVKATIIVAGAAPPRLSVRLDGIPIERSAPSGGDTAYAVEVAPAEHQLLATIDGQIIFASWIAISDAATAARVNVSGAGTCGREGFSEVRHGDGRVRAAGVTCPRWIAAVPGERHGSVLVARCEQDSCGPLLQWRRERLPGAVPTHAHGKLAGWPTWATWTLVGIGAATAATTALVATGAFETRPVERRFVVGGARQE